jgi:toxin secretion/phage lysis holin
MELTQNAGTKTLLGLFTAVLMYYWNCFTEIMIILFVVLILDYVTGIIQGLLDGGFSLEKAWKGIVKKLMYGVLLIAALSVDFIIMYMAEALGADWGMQGMVGIAVCLYLIGTEGFSIVQNLLLIGVPAPDFLQKIFGLVRDNAGKLVKISPKDGDGI